jgi:hypothetical protein
MGTFTALQIFAGVFAHAADAQQILPQGPLTCAWNASERATGYHVFVDDEQVQVTSELTAQLAPLTLGSHRIGVTAFNDAGESAPTSIFVQVVPLLPATPENFRITAAELRLSISLQPSPTPAKKRKK